MSDAMMLLDGEMVPLPQAVADALPQEGPAPVPLSVTRFQARAVMRRQILPDGRTLLRAIEADLHAAVLAAQALPPTHADRLAAEDAADAWDEALSFERGSALVTGLAAGYGLTPEAVDAMFVAAAQVTA